VRLADRPYRLVVNPVPAYGFAFDLRVESVHQAKEALVRWQTERGIGPADVRRGRGDYTGHGDVLDREGCLAARVSYDGRVRFHRPRRSA
jgi:hypothetical protein